MKKLFILLTAFSITCSGMTNDIFANENDTILVCHFEEDENGDVIEVCEEISTYQLCTPECWDT